MSAPLHILGIDPGLQLTGYAVVALDIGPATRTLAEPRLVEAGVIRLKPKTSVEHRLVELHRELIDLIKEHAPHTLAIEKLYAHYKHPRTAIVMAHARGVILLAAKAHAIQIAHLPATAVKKAITGHGHASKAQIQRAVQSQYHLPEPPSPPDVADAIAIATCHARRIAIEQL